MRDRRCPAQASLAAGIGKLDQLAFERVRDEAGPVAELDVPRRKGSTGDVSGRAIGGQALDDQLRRDRSAGEAEQVAEVGAHRGPTGGAPVEQHDPSGAGAQVARVRIAVAERRREVGDGRRDPLLVGRERLERELHA
jgi:hypothetical protein